MIKILFADVDGTLLIILREVVDASLVGWGVVLATEVLLDRYFLRLLLPILLILRLLL